MSLKTLYFRALILSVLVLISFGVKAQAQEVQLTLPNQQVNNGTTAFSVPITFTNSNPPIDAFTIEVNFDPNVIQINADRFSINGTVLAPNAQGIPPCTPDSEIIQNSPSAGRTTLRIVAGCTRPLTATSGTLLNLLFDTVAPGFTSLVFTVRASPNPVPLFEQIPVPGGTRTALTVGVTNGSVNVIGTTAASVNINGRVLTGEGRGLRGAIVRLTTADGTTRTSSTTSFGYYRFANVQAGQTVTLQILSKKFVFQPQTVNLTGDVVDLNFFSQP